MKFNNFRIFKLNWAVHNPIRTNSNSLPENNSPSITSSMMPVNTNQKFIKKQKYTPEYTVQWNIINRSRFMSEN
jgi:hypothetical protein